MVLIRSSVPVLFFIAIDGGTLAITSVPLFAPCLSPTNASVWVTDAEKLSSIVKGVVPCDRCSRWFAIVIMSSLSTK